jgi:hypothetical protein
VRERGAVWICCFRYRPLDLCGATLGFDGTLVFAINQFAFEEDVIARLDLGRIVRGGSVVGDTAMPLCLLLPLLLRIFITFSRGDGELCHAPAVLRSRAGIFACEACECYAIDIHKKFVPF